MDWNHFKILEALATSGTISLASKSLKIDVSTLTRNLQKIEAGYGKKLFKKDGTYYLPTLDGVEVLRKCRELKAIVDSMGFEATGHKKVTITSLESFFNHYLIPRIPHFSFSIELLEADRTLNLARREADVAIRFARPTTGEYIVKELFKVGYAVYASQNFGAKDFSLDKAPWAVLNDQFEQLDDIRWIRNSIGSVKAAYQLTSYQQILTFLASGKAVGILPCFIGDRIPGLCRVHSEEPIFFRTGWMAIHKDIINLAAVREFKEWLTAQTRKDRILLSGAKREN